MRTQLRNATLQDLATLLAEQQARKVDVVVGANALSMDEGVVVLKDTEPVFDDDGVTLTAGRYVPTDVFDEGVSAKLGIPLPYVRKMHLDRPDLYDANVNGWLHGRKAKVRWDGNIDGGFTELRAAVDPDPRQFLVRAFKSDDGSMGIARALLSDRYARIDNLDILTAALDGVRSAGVDVKVTKCDLTERKMYVVVEAPAVRAMAPVLLAGYRSPFDGNGHGQAGLRDEDGNLPIVHAGFIITNSETGGGAAAITPRLVVKVCTNGMTINALAQRSVHLGRSLDEGVVKWTESTQSKSLDLMRSMTADAVASFCSPEFVAEQVDAIERKAAAPVNNAADTVQLLGKRMAYTEAETKGILDHFIMGGQMTAGGVLNAITSFAQVVEDPDAAHALEDSAMRAFALVPSLS